MNPITNTTSGNFVSAQDTLAALQQAWAHLPPSEIAVAPSRVELGADRLPLPESFLDLRAISQIPIEDVHEAFPMLASNYPVEWKEQVRQLRTRLTTAQAELEGSGETLQILALTSMDGHRNRYGTASNLALALASMHDTRVLVIDASLSAPTLHATLRVPPGPGLCEATRAHRVALTPCFRRITGTQIYLLSVGDIHTYPMDPLDLRGLHNLLQSLREQFDWIILDGPGFDTPADTMAITSTADGTIMIIERERDSFRDVARALGAVQGRRLLGAVMF